MLNLTLTAILSALLTSALIWLHWPKKKTVHVEQSTEELLAELREANEELTKLVEQARAKGLTVEGLKDFEIKIFKEL